MESATFCLCLGSLDGRSKLGLCGVESGGGGVSVIRGLWSVILLSVYQKDHHPSFFRVKIIGEWLFLNISSHHKAIMGTPAAKAPQPHSLLDLIAIVDK